MNEIQAKRIERFLKEASAVLFTAKEQGLITGFALGVSANVTEDEEGFMIGACCMRSALDILNTDVLLESVDPRVRAAAAARLEEEVREIATRQTPESLLEALQSLGHRQDFPAPQKPGGYL